MRRTIPILSLLLITIAATLARADDHDVLASQVLQVFQAKCTQCHSPQAKKIKKFGYVDDLKKLGSSKYVVRGIPDESDLYKTVKADEMPPDDSGIPACTPAEKDLIKKWITDGAPYGSTPSTSPSTVPSTASTQAAPPAAPKPSFFKRTGIFLGKLHPLAAHFPIALLMGALFAEAICFRKPTYDLTVASRFCTVLGTLGALATTGLGWVHGSFHSSSALVEQHRWLGVYATLASVPVAVICEFGSRRALAKNHPWHGFWRWFYRLSLLGCVAMISYAAHVGGAITQGEDYLVW